MKRLENFQDLTQINDDDNMVSKAAAGVKSGKGKKEVIKTIGFSIKKSAKGKIADDFNELNASFIVNDDDVQMYDINNFIIDVDGDEIEDDVNRDIKFNLKINLSHPTTAANENEDLADDEELIDIDFNLHASINQYKLKFLGSVRGMNEFKEFLKSTNGGYRLLKFWLDCEFYRDSMQDYDQIENMATRNRLFRDITEKYVFHFAKKMHKKISESYANNEQRLNHNLFDQIQYDILRRLRAYWVPRFIINKLKQRGKNYGSHPLPPLTPDYSRQSTYLSSSSAIKTASTDSNENKNKPYGDGQLNSSQKEYFKSTIYLF